jgi:hypothetical protein
MAMARGKAMTIHDYIDGNGDGDSSINNDVAALTTAAQTTIN